MENIWIYIIIGAVLFVVIWWIVTNNKLSRAVIKIEEADQTELLDSAYEKAPEEDEEIKYNNEETQDENLEYDENGMPLQREEPLKLERKKKEEKYGYMNLPLILVLLTIFGIGLYFLTKYILLK